MSSPPERSRSRSHLDFPKLQCCPGHLRRCLPAPGIGPVPARATPVPRRAIERRSSNAVGRQQGPGCAGWAYGRALLRWQRRSARTGKRRPRNPNVLEPPALWASRTASAINSGWSWAPCIRTHGTHHCLPTTGCSASSERRSTSASGNFNFLDVLIGSAFFLAFGYRCSGFPASRSFGEMSWQKQSDGKNTPRHVEARGSRPAQESGHTGKRISPVLQRN